MRCTWVECQQEATHPQRDADGEPWADLCLHHHAGMRAAMIKSIPVMMATWIKAQGGAKKASQRVERGNVWSINAERSMRQRMKEALGMVDPFETLYNALADASNALGDISDIPDTPDTIAIRASIDKHIDAALGEIRQWKEALE